MIESVGYAGGLLLAACGAPQAWMCHKDKTAHGISGMFLGMWYAGEWLVLAYVLYTIGLDWPLIINYSLNICFITIIIYYFLLDKLKT